jgi:hypothetical protein
VSGSGGLFGSNVYQPGQVDPFSLAALSAATGNAQTAMHNRYAQLGLGVPSGGSPQSAGSSGTNLSYGGPGTAEQMDIGSMPSLTGGIAGMSEAALGEMENNSLQLAGQPIGGTGKGGFA